jgi:hypothetical protein
LGYFEGFQVIKEMLSMVSNSSTIVMHYQPAERGAQVGFGGGNTNLTAPQPNLQLNNGCYGGSTSLYLKIWGQVANSINKRLKTVDY